MGLTRGVFKAHVEMAHARGHKPKRLPRQAEPFALKLRYGKRIKQRVLEPAMALVRKHLVPHLEELAAREPSRIAVRDASDLEDDLGDIIDEISDTYFDTFTRKEFAKVVRPVADEAARFQAQQLNRQLSAAIGDGVNIDVVGSESWLPATTDTFVRENVALIKSIPQTFFAELEKTISSGLADGDRWEDLATKIEDRYGVAEAKAELIARDQMGKFNGDLNKVRQQDLGINSFTWRTVGDERVRTDAEAGSGEGHVERNGVTYAWDSPPNGEIPGEPIQCVPDDSDLQTHSRILRAYRRPFRGHLTKLVTANGEVLSTTPNHPILTGKGWQMAQLIEVGDELVITCHEGGDALVGNQNHTQTKAVEVFNALQAVFGSELRDTGAAGFHGDGSDQEVCVVDVDWSLCLKVPASFEHGLAQDTLALAYQVELGAGPFLQCFDGLFAAQHNSVRGGCQLLSFVIGQEAMTDKHSVRARAGLKTLADNLGAHGCAAYAQPLCEFLDARTISVALRKRCAVVLFSIVGRAVMNISSLSASRPKSDTQIVRIAEQSSRGLSQGQATRYELCRVVDKSVCEFSAHVVNLSTENESFLAQGAVVHNCRCYADPVVESVIDDSETSEE